jgi:hypothetical protein
MSLAEALRSLQSSLTSKDMDSEVLARRAREARIYRYVAASLMTLLIGFGLLGLMGVIRT